MFYYRYQYFPAQPTILFQGTQDELRKKLAQTGLIVLKGGNGSYLLGRPSFGTIYEFEDETSTQPLRYVTPSKDMLRMRYDKQRITEKDYAKLTEELNQGEITFDSLL